MNAKEYLLQIRKIDKIINNRIEEAEHWRSVATGTTAYSEGDRVQSSGNKQKMENAVCRYLQMEAEVNEYIDKLVDVRQEILLTIENLPTADYEVLHKAYVQCKNFTVIAFEMGKSRSWVTSVHDRALQGVQQMLDRRNEVTNEQMD